MEKKEPLRGEEVEEFIETVVYVNRSAKVTKGGRVFSFSALVVVGDGKGKVGYGYGKAKEVPAAVEKATKKAKRDMQRVVLKGTTIPYQTTGRFSAARVILVPASPGTGVIASAPVRAVVEAVGIRDILTKSIGSNTPANVVKAVLNGLRQLKDKGEMERLRGVTIE